MRAKFYHACFKVFRKGLIKSEVVFKLFNILGVEGLKIWNVLIIQKKNHPIQKM